jgi:hypothetical protein
VIAILVNEQIRKDSYPTTDPISWNTFNQPKQCPQTPDALLNRLNLIPPIPKISFRILAVCSVVVSLRILGAVHWVLPLLQVFGAVLSRLLRLVQCGLHLEIPQRALPGDFPKKLAQFDLGQMLHT